MIDGVLHTFFRLFWPMHLFWPIGLTEGRAWRALEASPEDLGDLWTLWEPLDESVWELLGSLGASGGL